MASASAAVPWREHHLEEIPVSDGDVGDAVTCMLHTILFTRAPGPVRPSEATCHAFPSVSYSLCAVGDVSRKVEHAVKAFEEALAGHARNELDAAGPYGGGGGGIAAYAQRHASFGGSQRLSFGSGGGNGGGGSLAAAATSGCLVVAFFERKVKHALFGLMSNEEKIYFEKWIVPVSVARAPESPSEHEVAARETEAALQNALLHILSAVQTIDHIPNAMYDFEITQYASLEAMQSEGSYGIGRQGSASVRLLA